MKNLIYTQLFNASEKHVKNFRSDFEIDKKVIGENPKRKFIHIAREHGTALINFFNGEDYPKAGENIKYLFATANRKKILKSNFETLEYYLKNDPKKIHYFNGTTLKAINKDTAIQIYETYCKSLIQIWEAEDKNNFKN